MCQRGGAYADSTHRPDAPWVAPTHARTCGYAAFIVRLCSMIEISKLAARRRCPAWPAKLCCGACILTPGLCARPQAHPTWLPSLRPAQTAVIEKASASQHADGLARSEGMMPAASAIEVEARRAVLWPATLRLATPPSAAAHLRYRKGFRRASTGKSWRSAHRACTGRNSLPIYCMRVCSRKRPGGAPNSARKQRVI